MKNLGLIYGAYQYTKLQFWLLFKLRYVFLALMAVEFFGTLFTGEPPLLKWVSTLGEPQVEQHQPHQAQPVPSFEQHYGD